MVERATRSVALLKENECSLTSSLSGLRVWRPQKFCLRRSPTMMQIRIIASSANRRSCPHHLPWCARGNACRRLATTPSLASAAKSSCAAAQSETSTTAGRDPPLTIFVRSARPHRGPPLMIVHRSNKRRIVRSSNAMLADRLVCFGALG